jgi:hypothetical protein
MRGAARELGLVGIAALALACGGGAETAERSGAAPAGADEATAPADTIVVAGFRTPESVLHDPEADVYLVSNVDGPPAAMDGNGYVSRLAPDGTVLEPKWIDGAAEGVELNGPKGMALSGDTLFVADIDAVRLFDRTSGVPLGAWPVPGATFLNDVVIGPGGRIYASDTGIRITDSGIEDLGSGAIWRFAPDGTPGKVKDGDEADVNGLALAPIGLVAVTTGPGTVFALSDAGRTELPTVGGTLLDGVVAPGDGSLLVSDWQTSAVYRIDPEGNVETVFEGVDSPADIGWDAKRSRLLIPSFNADEVWIVPLRL